MRLVDDLVGWFLNDTAVWLRLAEVWTFDAKPQYRIETREEQRLEPDGTTTTLSRIDIHVTKPKSERVRLPVPPLPPGYGKHWYVIFRSVYKRFRAMLKKIRPLRDEDDRWISYGLSYEALKRCARLGKFAEFAYVHRACLNAHIRYLKEEEWSFVSLDDLVHAQPAVQTRWGDIDLRLDLEGVLQPFDQKDAEICRLYLIEEMTFEEIGAKVGLHASSVQRRFKKILPAFRQIAEDYVRPNSPDSTPAIDDLTQAA
jgi:hypothetical protein